MGIFKITVEMDERKCEQCGRMGKGFYEIPSAPGKYVCHKCVLKNINREGKHGRTMR